jgi:hypothetical protein
MQSIAVRVTTDSGAAVTDLARTEFQLELDGLRWPVDSATLVERRRATSTRLEASPYLSNRAAASARDIIFVIDADAIGSAGGAMLRAAVSAGMERLMPEDRLSLAILGRDRAAFGPTTNPERILSAVGRLDLLGLDVCRVADAAGALFEILESWSSPLPPIVVLFTAVTTARPSLTGDYCALSDDQRTLVTTVAASTGADVAVVQLRNRASELPSNTGLVRLAAAIGAPLVRLSDKPERIADLIVDGSRAYYRLAFAVPSEMSLVPSKELRVAVRRPGVDVRFPTVLRDVASRTVSAVVVSNGTWPDLPLRASTLVSGATTAGRMLVIVFEEDSPEALAEAAVAVFNGQGKLVRRWNATQKDLAVRPISAAVRVPPHDLYRVRVAAVGQSGLFGSLDQELKFPGVEDESNSRFSSIVLGVGRNETLAPRLTFADDRTATAYLELYRTPKSVTVRARFELLSADQAPILAVPGDVRYSQKSSAYLIEAQLPIAALAPGDYRVRAIVTVGTQQLQPVITTLRKAGSSRDDLLAPGATILEQQEIEIQSVDDCLFGFVFPDTSGQESSCELRFQGGDPPVDLRPA